MWSRRYDPYDQYPPPGYRRGPYRRYPRGGGGSCLRDACLLETGCCLGEAIDQNCLTAGLLLVPQFAGAVLAGLVRSGAARSPGRWLGTGRPDRAQRRAVGGMVAAIEVYQREISARRRPCCRFSPTCSRYAIEALRTHGAVRGALLTVRRLLRCRPGGRRGADPVPPPQEAVMAPGGPAR
jgi:putative membrane protein insertion efficiency factor